VSILLPRRLVKAADGAELLSLKRRYRQRGLRLGGDWLLGRPSRLIRPDLISDVATDVATGLQNGSKT
jgi:hypothetical protein